MPQHRFTTANAKEYAARATAARKAAEAHRQALRLLPQPVQDNNNHQASVFTDPNSDVFSAKLSRACLQTLNKVIVMVRQDEPAKAAQLARALRDLRETWHLATGKPRPGLTRPDKEIQVRREVPRVMPGQDNGPPQGQAPTQ